MKTHSCDYPRRNLRWHAGEYMDQMRKTPDYIRLRKVSSSSAFYFQEGTPYVSGAEVTVVHMWQAHKDCIKSIQYINNPTGILTASFDRLVRVWSQSGELLGTLRQVNSYIRTYYKQKDSATLDLELILICNCNKGRRVQWEGLEIQNRFKQKAMPSIRKCLSNDREIR